MSAYIWKPYPVAPYLQIRYNGSKRLRLKDCPMTDPSHKRLKARREYLGISQATLAKAIDRSRPTIAAMEAGRTVITTEHLVAFAKVLRVDPA